MSTSNELIDNVGWNLHLLPGKSERLIALKPYFKPLLEGDRQDSRADGIHLRSTPIISTKTGNDTETELLLESQVEGRGYQRLQLLRLSVIRYANDWDLRCGMVNTEKGLDYGLDNLGLLDQRVQSTNTTAITCRHAVDFIHDKTRLVCDLDSKRVCVLESEYRS